MTRNTFDARTCISLLLYFTHYEFLFYFKANKPHCENYQE